MDDVEPVLFLFFSNLESKFGMEAYHPFLVRGSISIVCVDGQSEFFFGPVVFDDKVVVDKTTSSKSRRA